MRERTGMMKWRRLTAVAIASWLAVFFVALPLAYGQQQGSGTAISPELRQKVERLIREGKLTPEQEEQALRALARGELTAEDVDKLAGVQLPGTLTAEEIDLGKKLLEERQRKGVLEREALPEMEAVTAKPIEAERKPAEELEEVEKPELRKQSELEPEELPIFGHELFTRPPSTFAPITQVPVSDTYVVGPGDEIKVQLWGRIDAEYTLRVDTEGMVHFPRVGPLVVAGLTYREVKDLIKRKAEAITGVSVNVSMGRLRSIQVFVLGEVKSPGVYTVSSLATLSNALLTSGGPTRLGSLRQVQLKRAGKVVATVDFYDFMLRGDTSGDSRLMPADVIFVPQAGPMVAVAGNVKRPAIYELKDDRTLQRALALAGGLAPQAYDQRIQIERAYKNETKVVLDIPYDRLAKQRPIPLEDGDRVRVFSILEKPVNAVYLYGNVWRPGTYAYKPGMRLTDLIPDLESLKPDTALSYGLVKRHLPEEMVVQLLPFDLERLLLKRDRGEDINLQPRDEVYVFQKSLFEEKPQVSITGQIRKPGRYRIDKMKVKDLIYQAGGLTRDAYLPLGHLYRTDPETFKVELIAFSVEGALNENPEDNLTLQHRDEVVIHSVREYLPEKKVSIEGMVNAPGEYTYAPNMTIRDLVLLAGNIKESAYLDRAELFRYQIERGKRVQTELVVFDLGKALAGDPAHNHLLHPYDRVLVKEVPKWLQAKTVTLMGEVRFPGVYTIRPGETLSSVLYRAGGFTPEAYLRGAVFTRESARKIQEQRLREMRERLRQEIYRASSKEVQAALTQEEVAALKQTLAAQEGLLKRLEQVKASGRVVIRLQPLPIFAGSSHDVVLEDGDTLMVPPVPGTVNVIGQVYNPTSLVYDKKHPELEFYLAKVGGPTKNAEEDQIYVIRADGTVVSKEKSSWGVEWDETRMRWAFARSFYSTKLMPGDTVLVPEKIIVPRLMRDIRDIVQILYQIAITAGVTVAIF